MMKIPAQIDLEAAPGRKSSHGVDFESQTASKPSKIEKINKSRKNSKTQGKLKFLMFEIYFRSADAANHLNARPWAEIGVNCRAYIPKIY